MKVRKRSGEGDSMSKVYTTKELLDKVIKASVQVSTFYKKDFLNYRGRTLDTGELYTEVISGWLLENLSILEEIPVIRRERGYHTGTHHGYTAASDSIREEERIAMAMFRQREFEGLGKILDYQTPLKNRRKDAAGKIDLLAYDGKVLRLLELKEPQSKETLLRCVLEGYTYLKTVDRKLLIASFANIEESAQMKASPLIFRNGFQHQAFKDPEQKNLRALMNALDSRPYCYSGTNEEGYRIEAIE